MAASSCSVECGVKEDQRGVVLRVKRKRTLDPVEALVVSHVPAKKAHLSSEEPRFQSKTTDQGNVKVDQLFRFLGTCNEADDTKSKDLLKNIKSKPISHDNLKKCDKGLTEHLQKRKREAKKESHSDARFKILSINRHDDEPPSSCILDSNENEKSGKSEFKRTISSDGSTDSADDEVRRLFKVYDVIRDEEREKSAEASSSLKVHQPEDTNAILCNSVKMMREKLAVSEGSRRPVDIPEKGYVYDFYYAPSSREDLGDILEITGVNDDFFLEKIDKEFDEMFDDEDDSNDENNWRNDYPDEDFGSSDEECLQTRRHHFVDEDFGFDMDDDGTKYHKQAFGEDLSSDDDELDCYGQPYKLSSSTEAYKEELSDEGF